MNGKEKKYKIVISFKLRILKLLYKNIKMWQLIIQEEINIIFKKIMENLKDKFKDFKSN